MPIRDTSGGRKATATATASPFRSRIQREGAPKRQTSSKAGNARSYARRARHKKEKEGPATAKPTAKTNPRSTFQVRVLCIIEHPPPSEANRILSLACARLLEETVSQDLGALYTLQDRLLYTAESACLVVRERKQPLGAGPLYMRVVVIGVRASVRE